MQFLDTLPEEVLELILKRLSDPVDLINCSRAHPRLDEELRKFKGFYLFPQILPLIAKKLAVTEALKIPDVCPEWKDAVAHFDENVPGRQPYNDDVYLHQMKIFGKDPSEHKWNTDVWFLSFNSIGRDLRRFETEMKKHPEKLPFGIGRSAYFEINHNEWQIQQIYLRKLETYLQKFGKHFWYVKLNVTVSYSVRLNQLENCAFIRLFMANLPNARSVEICVDIDDAGTYVSSVEQALLPHLTQLESLSLSLGGRNSELRERHIIANHAAQLKKLSLTARPGNLPQRMPHLVELYIHSVRSNAIFQDLQLLEAPLQKLTLNFHTHSCQFEMVDLLASIKHLPLRHLDLRWNYVLRHVNDYGIFRNIDPKFKKIQFPSLHTVTLYNFPEDWHPLLVSFPSLTYVNIRLTSPCKSEKDSYRILRKRDDLMIRKIMFGYEEKFVKYPASLRCKQFPKLKQITAEMWNCYGFGQTGQLVASQKWTRNSGNEVLG